MASALSVRETRGVLPGFLKAPVRREFRLERVLPSCVPLRRPSAWGSRRNRLWRELFRPYFQLRSPLCSRVWPPPVSCRASWVRAGPLHRFRICRAPPSSFLFCVRVLRRLRLRFPGREPPGPQWSSAWEGGPCAPWAFRRQASRIPPLPACPGWRRQDFRRQASLYS